MIWRKITYIHASFSFYQIKMTWICVMVILHINYKFISHYPKFDFGYEVFLIDYHPFE
jgi:hypothetical protein